MFIPVAISCYSHDFITNKYQFTESVFKHAMFKHQVFDDEDIMKYMTQKQFELMTIAQSMAHMPPPPQATKGPI